MTLREHLVAAGLALVVLAISLALGTGDDLATPDPGGTPVETAGP